MESLPLFSFCIAFILMEGLHGSLEREFASIYSNTTSSTATTIITTTAIPTPTTPTTPENIDMKRLGELKSTLEKGSLDRAFIQSPPIEVGYIVPYKLHFIWITHPMPEKYLENLKTYRKFNQIYQIHLWVDDKSLESGKVAQDQISKLILHDIKDLDMVDFYLFSKATNVGAKADILRYEVVWSEGGIYCDIDSVALKPFDSNFLHSFVSFTLDPYYNLSNAVFGFPKQSNFLKFVLSLLEENFEFETYPPSLSGPTFLTTCFLAFKDQNINIITQDLLIFHNNKSFTYHTNDANWLKEIN